MIAKMKTILATCLCAIACAHADVQTNVWISTTGGSWTNSTNWSRPELLGTTFYADLSMISEPEAVVQVTNNTPVLGVRFAPSGMDAGTTNVCKFACFDGRSDSTVFIFYKEGDVQPEIFVGSGAAIDFSGSIRCDYGTVRINCRGGGQLNLMGTGELDTILDLHDVYLVSRSSKALNSHLVYLFPEAVWNLSADAYPREVVLDAEDDFNPIALNGHLLSPVRGTRDCEVSVDLFANGGTLSAMGGHVLTLSQSQSVPLNYRIEDGDIVFNPKSRPLVACLFNDADSIGKNDGTLADLVVGGGTPQIVTDTTRGSVLYLNGSSTKLVGPENGNLPGLPTGSGDYTIALWLKMDSGNPNNGGILFWGTWSAPRKCTVLRCAQDKSNGNFMYSHYSSDFQVSQATEAFDGEWHHLAIIRKQSGTGMSGSEMIYLDGKCVESKYLDADIQEGTFNLGCGQTTSFKGWMDDFMIIPRAISAGQVANLMNADGVRAMIRHVSPGTNSVIDVAGHGMMRLSGAQTVGALAGEGMAGAVRMDGDLTVGGPGRPTNTVYRAEIAGTGAFVKCGADYNLTLAGSASYTGDTRVEEGRLAVRSHMPAVRQVGGLVAEWLFDEPSEPGRDSSGNNFSLAAQEAAGVASVVNDATRGYVLKIDSTSGMRFRSQGAYPVAFPSGSAAYSVAFWFKTAEDTKDNAVLCFWGNCEGDVNSKATIVRLDGTSGLMFSNWGNNYFTNDRNYRDGEWHHVISVYGTDRKRRFYVDGAKIDPENWVSLTIETDEHPFYLGSRAGSSNVIGFKGWMDDVRFYSFALTDEEAAAEYAGNRTLAHNSVVAVTPEEIIPQPVVKFTFEDASAPYASSGGTTEMALEAVGNASVTNDDQRAGKVLYLPSSGMNYLQATAIPAALPSGTDSITISLWAAPAQSALGTRPDGMESMFYYGNPAEKGKFHLLGNNGNLLRYTVDNDKYLSLSPRNYTAERRWYHYVITLSSSKKVACYIDGVKVEDSFIGTMNIDPLYFYIGRKTSSDTVSFRGLIDDVAIYDKVLTEEQVKRLYRVESGMAERPSLPVGTDVSVASGAVFALEDATDQVVHSLSGAGTVELSGASKLTLSSVVAGAFTGTWSGIGEVALADGVEVSAASSGAGLPVLSVPGQLTLPSHGTLDLVGPISSLQSGTLVLAEGASVSAPDGLGGWTFTVAGMPSEAVKAAFSVSNGALTVQVSKIGMMVIFR
jgi:autotransporter-associated beta strand protein